MQKRHYESPFVEMTALDVADVLFASGGDDLLNWNDTGWRNNAGGNSL